MYNRILIIAGPTASGKSGLAMRLARHLLADSRPSVIINADSMQIYQELPILTAQPSDAEMAEIPHLLYGIFPAMKPCSVAQWLDHAVQAIHDTHAEGKLPILVGGTGMYLKCLMDGIAIIPQIAQEIRQKARERLNTLGNKQFHILLNERDPIMGARLSPGDTQRMLRAWEVLEQTSKSIHEWQTSEKRAPFMPEQFRTALLLPPRETLYERCNTRFETMWEHGALEEAQSLLAQKLDPDLPAMKALGVPEIRDYLEGKYGKAEAIAAAQQATRRYAKRQTTWFRHQFTPDILLEEADENAML